MRGGVEVYSFDGDHTNFHQPPNVAALAAVLKGILEKLDEEERAQSRDGNSKRKVGVIKEESL